MNAKVVGSVFLLTVLMVGAPGPLDGAIPTVGGDAVAEEVIHVTAPRNPAKALKTFV